jgi:hypothetical protein
MEGSLPAKQTPAVRADFNARGWAGAGDTALYVLDPGAVAAATAARGTRVFVWDEDEPGTILGCLAILEHVSIGCFTGWRAVPVPDSFYRGPKPAFVAGKLGA